MHLVPPRMAPVLALQRFPSLAWGTHLGQIHTLATDLRETLVPYFRAGLENNERCLWVTDAPFDASDALPLRASIPDFDQRENAGQIHHSEDRGLLRYTAAS